MHPAEKPLNQMNRLADMLHFPPLVNAGATLNILLTMTLTWYLEARYPLLPGPWIALVLLLNLTPVLLLRLTIKPGTPYPSLRTMNFIQDQHKFSDWVYLAASANMTFWILITWTLATWFHRTPVLIAALFIAFLITFSPVLFRSFLKSHPHAG